MPSRLKNILSGVVIAALLASVITIAQSTVAPNAPAEAAQGKDFNAGMIMSDEVFYNPSTMSTSAVQAFLEARVPTCRSGYTCLKSFRQSTTSQPARSEGCSAFSGASNESAAAIIVKVAQSCGINPRVILVLLEKEQGLVTDTWPGANQYRKATGYACPDTADCDAAYNGFFNQVYNAAWQFKKYRARPADRGYVAGRTNTIQWNPNGACGSSQVYIENQATAGLYVYTPYRPNAAALANMYGTGDGCSAYGNRNFWRMFTDWFGSTTQKEYALVKRAGGSEIYVISAGIKYHVATQADYTEFTKAFGTRQEVSTIYLQSMPTGPDASLFITNTLTGAVSLLQGGKTHKFATCAAVSHWGGSCSSGLMPLTEPIYTSIAVGPAMTNFVASGGKTYLLESSKLYPMYNAAAAAAFNRGKAPYAATMTATVAKRYSVGAVRVAPASLMRTSASSALWYVDGTNRRYSVTTTAITKEFGLTSTTPSVIPDAVFAGYKDGGKLSLFTQCGTKLYAATQGSFAALAQTGAGGFTVTPLSGWTCNLLKLTAAAVPGGLYLKAVGAPEVYVALAGQLRYVSSPTVLKALNGGSTPRIVSVGRTSLSTLKRGLPALGIGALVRTVTDDDVYLVSGTSLIPVKNLSAPKEFGISTKVHIVDGTRFTGYKTSSSPLGVFAQCGSDVLLSSAGKAVRVTKAASDGNVITGLNWLICNNLARSTSSISGAIIVASGSKSAVAVAGGFAALPNSAAATEANGGKASQLQALSSDSFANLPAAKSLPSSGSLVRGSTNTAVYLIVGSTRVPLPNWGIAADLGLITRYAVVSPTRVAPFSTSANGLGNFVRCGKITYFGAGGVLRAVTDAAATGFPVVALDTAACATLKISAEPTLATVYVAAPTGTDAWLAKDGKYTSAGNVKAVPAGSVVLRIDARTLASLPRS
ncbi:hypothetical protein [Leifsonia sp. Leaf264]|uniref:hypothetical protein n=1 Tax=Leifsonia sp. Leaf264 TaxID=1736314 RepID=UPI0006FC3F48|nr:hypothetical protein [Leifsonia sp. Leaf264]KQO99417.1 hypothetical protein ASF30_05620 [Leifsonia sp. Leaf264]